jgi:hypothetical protein
MTTMNPYVKYKFLLLRWILVVCILIRRGYMLLERLVSEFTQTCRDPIPLSPQVRHYPHDCVLRHMTAVPSASASRMHPHAMAIPPPSAAPTSMGIRRTWCLQPHHHSGDGTVNTARTIPTKTQLAYL